MSAWTRLPWRSWNREPSADARGLRHRLWTAESREWLPPPPRG